MVYARRMRAVVVMAMLCACEPGVGETRCSTSTLYGSTYMNCKQGPPHESRPQQVAAAPQAAVFWCATRQSDGFGYCASQPGECENLRGGLFSPCAYQAHAICATSGCFTTPEACAKVERLAKRDASACVLRR